MGFIRGSRAQRSDVPFKYLTDVREMHLNAVLILVGAKIHLRELASLVQFIDGCKNARNTGGETDDRGVLGRSSGKPPRGVAYSVHLESAHPGR